MCQALLAYSTSKFFFLSFQFKNLISFNSIKFFQKQQKKNSKKRKYSSGTSLSYNRIVEELVTGVDNQSLTDDNPLEQLNGQI